MTEQALSYAQRLDALRETKIAHTQEKQELVGAMNHDDHALVLPPPEARELRQA